MDGENNGKPYEQMGWFGGIKTTPIFGNTHIPFLVETSANHLQGVEKTWCGVWPPPIFVILIRGTYIANSAKNL